MMTKKEKIIQKILQLWSDDNFSGSFSGNFEYKIKDYLSVSMFCIYFDDAIEF